MPTSSSINLLPPPPPPPASNAAAQGSNTLSSSDDGDESFQQTLSKVQKRKTDSTDDEKSSTKKAHRSAKAKQPQPTAGKKGGKEELVKTSAKKEKPTNEDPAQDAPSKQQTKSPKKAKTTSKSESGVRHATGAAVIQPTKATDAHQDAVAADEDEVSDDGVAKAVVANAAANGAQAKEADSSGESTDAQPASSVHAAKVPGFVTATVKASDATEEAADDSQTLAAASSDESDDVLSAFDDMMQAMNADAHSAAGSHPSGHGDQTSNDALLGLSSPTAQPAASIATKASAPVPTPTPEAQFAEANHPTIVTGVSGQLQPNGGTMQIRLDPPELGALLVSVHMRDGVMTASFETSNESATRMLSHSLNQLKSALESAGMSVEKLHVQQSTKQDPNSSDSEKRQSANEDQQHENRQEQQRREMLRRMWRKLSGGGDPLDLVA